MSTIPTITSQTKSSGSPLTRVELSKFLPTKRAIDVFNALTVDVPTVIDQSNLLAQQIDTFNFNFDALNADVLALQAEDANLQAQIDGIDVTSLGSIAGLVDGNVTDNSPTIQHFLGPAELSGAIIAADGVFSSVPQSGVYRMLSRVDLDRQVSAYWNGRGAITIVPDGRMPAIVPGTYASGIRTGGGAPNSAFRWTCRAPAFNKQAFEPLMGGFNIDATGENSSGNFTSSGTQTINATNHQRSNGDTIFFDNSPNGANLPTGVVNGNSLDYSKSFKIANATTNTFQVCAWNSGTLAYDTTPVTVGAGGGVWTTNVSGVRIPNCQTSSNANDPDQAFDNRKNYTAGTYHDMDILNMSGHGILSEAGCGRLHLHSTRTVGNRMDGIHIGSNDTVFSGHWASGSNGGWSVFKGSGTGLYAATGNIWGSPQHRSLNCGALKFADTAYFALVANEFNDWFRADGDANFNAAGAIVANMMHPHAENYSSDGVGIDVQASNDLRLQSNYGIAGYQGLVMGLNAWTRTETVSFDTWGNFGLGANTARDGNGKVVTGTAPQYLGWFGANAGKPAMVEVFDGVCSAPNVKPWQGPFLTAATATMFTSASTSVNWPSHPLVVGDRVFFHAIGAATMPSGFAADYPNQYFVVSVVDTNNVTLSATFGGSPITAGAGASGNTTIYQLSSAPYYISGSAQVAGVYVDSYRGVVNLWSVNGVAPKILIGTSFKSQPWEGNPNYYIELGTTDLTGGLRRRNVHWGQWEFDGAWGFTDNAFNAKQISGTGHTIGAGTAVQFYTTSGGTTIASATITLPTDHTQTRPLDIIFSSGGCTLLTWTVNGGGTINTNSVPLPSTWLGAMYVRLMFRRDNNTWFVESVSGAADPYVTLTIAVGAIATDCSKGRNFRVSQTGNATLSNPTNPQDGVIYTWQLTQDATGGRTITWGSNFRKLAGDTFTTTANTVTTIMAKWCAADTKFDVVSFRTGMI